MHAIRSWMRTRLHRLVAAGVVTSIALLLAGVAGVGQYPDCNWNCTSRDVQVVEAFVDAPATCTPGTAVSATLYATFDNGTNANRYAVRLIGGLYVDGRLEESLEVCALSTMPPGQSTAALTSLSWTCGEDVELRIVTVSWVARPSTCVETPTCSSRTAKCWSAPLIEVGGLPLSVGFASSAPACQRTAMAFTDQTTGGEPPYSYSWAFGDGVGTSSSPEPSYTYAVPGTYTVTLTVTDADGVNSSTSGTVTVRANPVATADNGGPYCPGDTIELLATGGVAYSWTGPNGFTSDIANPTIPNATSADAGLYTVVVSNASGCADQASTLVAIDAAAPTLTVPADVTIECGASISPETTGQATPVDDVDPVPTVTYTDAPASAGCGGSGTISRTWTAADACGNSVSGLQTITIVDTTPPTLLVSSATFVCDGAGNTADIDGWLASAAASDTCGGITVSHDYAGLSGACPGTGAATVTFTATDACGNTAERTATLRVVDSAPPTAGDDAATTPEDVAVTVDVLANDGDICSPALGIAGVGTPSFGSAMIVGGKIEYTPPAGFHGVATFSYTVGDCSGNVALGLAEVTVTPENDPPVANDEAVTAQEDTPVAITVTATDPDGDTLTYAILTGPSNGTITGFDPATGSLSYTANADYNGPDSFTFEACDPDGLCDAGTVTITVEPVDDPPVAAPQDLTTPEDTPLSITVTGSDADGDPLTYDIVSGPGSGVISGFDPVTGNLVYTPNPDYNGPDSFVFEACDPDPAHGCAQAVVRIEVTPVNDPPVARDQVRVTAEDTATGFFALAVSDPDNTLAELTCDCLVPPVHGTVERGPDHTVNYIPDPQFAGTDEFTYEVCDPEALCDTATVKVTVTADNDNPVVQADDQTTPEDTPVSFPVTHDDPDGDVLTCATSDPAHGSVVPASGMVSPPYPATATLTYTPDPGFFGIDQVVISCSDGNGGGDAITVEITVTPVNDPPVANDEAVTAEEDTPLAITVTATDPDGDAPAYSIVSGPSNGTITGFDPATGSLSYTANADYHGPDSFVFEACDPEGLCDTGEVTITVEPVDDPPLADPQDLTTPEDTPLSITVTGSDADGDPLTYGIVSGPGSGVISGFDPVTGELLYTPDPDYRGADSFVFEACDPDPAHGCAQAVVRIEVTPVNDPPLASDQVRVTSEDTATGFFALAISDPDNTLAELTCDCLVPPVHGTVERGPDHTVDYIPDPQFAGTDEFTYEVCDPRGLCDVATVTVVVLPVNDPPVARDDTASVAEDENVTIDVPGNDTDVDGDLNPRSVRIVSPPGSGTASVGPVAGEVTYEPNDDYYGVDVFVYEVCDSQGVCDTAVVEITVVPINDPPVANDDLATTAEEQPVVIDVTRNDIDIEGEIDPGSVTIITPPGVGTATVDPTTGKVTYTPPPDFDGTAGLVYQVCDLAGVCDTATVEIQVTPVNDPPSVECFEATVESASTTAFALRGSDPDSDPLTYSIDEPPAHGSIGGFDPTTGEFVYSPQACV